MVSALYAAIRMAWVISLVSVSSLTMSGLCWLSGILAGTAFASSWAVWSLRRAASTGASSLAIIALVITVVVPGAGLRSASSSRARAVPASARACLAALTAAAAVFFAGFGTLRSGSSGAAA